MNNKGKELLQSCMIKKLMSVNEEIDRESKVLSNKAMALAKKYNIEIEFHNHGIIVHKVENTERDVHQLQSEFMQLFIEHMGKIMRLQSHQQSLANAIDLDMLSELN